MYSFLYKDNPVFKFGEHMYVGISVGYYICLTWFNIMRPNLFDKIIGDPGFYWYLVFPGILGVMMLFRFSRSLSWVSRYPLAYYVAAGAGLAIPAIIQAYILAQMHSTFNPLWVSDLTVVELFTQKDVMKEVLVNFFTQIVIFVGVLSVLIYFFFSLEHRGAVGRISQVGIWFLMITFGASFGYTVMARISLLIGRMQFILGDWLGLKLG
ncbi:hypothetical protein KKB99_00765 [bacterium]|nr:hypothetical protein [bacterium]MBU1024517.1 hypothetical protein [bacterium]